MNKLKDKTSSQVMNYFVGLVHKHIYWPDTLEFITQTMALWNRWIRLSCYYNRV